jgi:hypothetical protein
MKTAVGEALNELEKLISALAYSRLPNMRDGAAAYGRAALTKSRGGPEADNTGARGHQARASYARQKIAMAIALHSARGCARFG